MSAMPSRSMDLLLEKVREASAEATSARNVALPLAVRAIRVLEMRLQESIAGGTLRGLPSFGSAHRGSTYYALRVGSEKQYLPPDGSPVLIIDRDGSLKLASQRFNEKVFTRPVSDGELHSTDFEDVIKAVDGALERHIRHTSQTTRSYEEVVARSQQLLELLRRL